MKFDEIAKVYLTEIALGPIAAAVGQSNVGKLAEVPAIKKAGEEVGQGIEQGMEWVDKLIQKFHSMPVQMHIKIIKKQLDDLPPAELSQIIDYANTLRQKPSPTGKPYRIPGSPTAPGEMEAAIRM